MQTPQILYKYQSFTPAALGNLAARQVWFSRPAAFNDPFDCAIRVDRGQISDSDFAHLYQFNREHSEGTTQFDALYLSLGSQDPVFHERALKRLDNAFEQRINQMRQLRGVCCFSEKVDDILMWSHYADYHKGLCLGFKTSVEPFSRARPVHYTTDVPSVNPIPFLLDDNEEDIFWAMILTKFACWSYEKEWRVFHTQADTAYGYEADVLQAVYFGEAMPESHQIVIGKLLHGTGTQFYRMERDAARFAVVPQPCAFEPAP